MHVGSKFLFNLYISYMGMCRCKGFQAVYSGNMGIEIREFWSRIGYQLLGYWSVAWRIKSRIVVETRKRKKIIAATLLTDGFSLKKTYSDTVLKKQVWYRVGFSVFSVVFGCKISWTWSGIGYPLPISPPPSPPRSTMSSRFRMTKLEKTQKKNSNRDLRQS